MVTLCHYCTETDISHSEKKPQVEMFLAKSSAPWDQHLYQASLPSKIIFVDPIAWSESHILNYHQNKQLHQEWKRSKSDSMTTSVSHQNCHSNRAIMVRNKCVSCRYYGGKKSYLETAYDFNKSRKCSSCYAETKLQRLNTFHLLWGTTFNFVGLLFLLFGLVLRCLEGFFDFYFNF